MILTFHNDLFLKYIVHLYLVLELSLILRGNGTTSAVQLLIDCLGLRHYNTATNQQMDENNENGSRPLILVGPMEHHSNLLPWREIPGLDIVTVPLNHQQGTIDMIQLTNILEIASQKEKRPFIIGSFAAVSNVTGIISDDVAVTKLLHKYNALSVWDYATGASYISPKMNNNLLSVGGAKDAIVFSGHKLLGASASTPGVLVVKKHLVSQRNPPTPTGGGTVFYVTQNSHRFLSNRVERWEAGTPNSVGIWRLGLAVKLKLDLCQAAALAAANGNKNNNTGNTSSMDYLWNIELERAQSFQGALSEIPNLVLVDDYGNDSIGDDSAGTSTTTKTEKRKVPIFSFLIKCGKRFLHYNYVCALLNDLFGIQSRGGCHCAGPYVQYLLGLTPESNVAIETFLISSKDELVRPGVTRLSLPT